MIYPESGYPIFRGRGMVPDPLQFALQTQAPTNCAVWERGSPSEKMDILYKNFKYDKMMAGDVLCEMKLLKLYKNPQLMSSL